MSGFASTDRWRRLAGGIDPVEVERSPRFSCRERLLEHVEKHALRGRDERWHRILAAELLARARDELAADGWGETCERVAEEYEGLVGSIVVERCREGLDHAHELTVREPWAESFRQAVVEETVYAWDAETRILAIASRRIGEPPPDSGWDSGGDPENRRSKPVSPAKPPRYRLRTGYRFHADRTPSRFRKEVLRKLDDLETFTRKGHPLWMVRHDGPEADNASRRPTEQSHES